VPIGRGDCGRDPPKKNCGCTCTARCRITASYGRKFVETMARPLACEIAQRVMSSGEACRSSAFHFMTCLEAISGRNQFVDVYGRADTMYRGIGGQDRAVAKSPKLSPSARSAA
jgi:hypothetical protein